MEHFFSNILLALGVAAAAPATEYVPIGDTLEFHVDIDMKSMSVEPKIGGWLIRSTIKRTLFKELAVEGKKKKGAYYVDKTSTACAQDTFKVEESTLYSKDGEVLADGTDLLFVENPHIPGNFFTDFIDIVCGVTKNVKPPMIT